MEEAVREYGALRGILMGIKRLLKCGPWNSGGYDPVPKKQIKKCDL
jgi:putative component of membrane protein insertase Oxa1/YidC/SpoIIIJ protein YidD